MFSKILGWIFKHKKKLLITLGVTGFVGILAWGLVLWFNGKFFCDSTTGSQLFCWMVQYNEALRNIGLLIAGVAGLIVLTWRAFAANKAARAAKEQASIAEQGHFTERFTKAVEQLGNEKSMAIRLGGIYALERLAKDSQQDHWTIMEVLTAFIRKQPNSQITDSDEQASTEDIRPEPIDADVQAALTVIGRRNIEHESSITDYLDLTSAYLVGAFLNKANLQSAIVHHADLRFAEIKVSNLHGTKFNDADLRNAIVVLSDFSEAILSGADLRDAHFIENNMDNVIFYFQTIEEVTSEANLLGTDFSGSFLNTSARCYAESQGAIVDDEPRLPEDEDET